MALDLDHPAVQAPGWSGCSRITEARAAAHAEGGGWDRQARRSAAASRVAAAAIFARLFVLPVKRTALPDTVLLAPAW